MGKITRLWFTMAISILLVGHNAQGQTFSEWFRQKATQRKYLLEQIAALKAYGMVLKKGYDISRDGLKAIGDIKDGDFNLHKGYFNSLKTVSPEVSKYPRAADIINLQQEIAAMAAKSKSTAGAGNVFTPSEISYINGVYDRLQKDCQQTLGGLEAVTTSGKLEMKDDERIERIDKLYKRTLDQYLFAKSFGQDLNLMAIQKEKETKDLQTLRRMYGIQ